MTASPADPGCPCGRSTRPAAGCAAWPAGGEPLRGRTGRTLRLRGVSHNPDAAGRDRRRPCRRRPHRPRRRPRSRRRLRRQLPGTSTSRVRRAVHLPQQQPPSDPRRHLPGHRRGIRLVVFPCPTPAAPLVNAGTLWAISLQVLPRRLRDGGRLVARRSRGRGWPPAAGRSASRLPRADGVEGLAVPTERLARIPLLDRGTRPSRHRPGRRGVGRVVGSSPGQPEGSPDLDGSLTATTDPPGPRSSPAAPPPTDRHNTAIGEVLHFSPARVTVCLAQLRSGDVRRSPVRRPRAGPRPMFDGNFPHPGRRRREAHRPGISTWASPPTRSPPPGSGMAVAAAVAHRAECPQPRPALLVSPRHPRPKSAAVARRGDRVTWGKAFFWKLGVDRLTDGAGGVAWFTWPHPAVFPSSSSCRWPATCRRRWCPPSAAGATPSASAGAPAVWSTRRAVHHALAVGSAVLAAAAGGVVLIVVCST